MIPPPNVWVNRPNIFYENFDPMAWERDMRIEAWERDMRIEARELVRRIGSIRVNEKIDKPNKRFFPCKFEQLAEFANLGSESHFRRFVTHGCNERFFFRDNDGKIYDEAMDWRCDGTVVYPQSKFATQFVKFVILNKLCERGILKTNGGNVERRYNITFVKKGEYVYEYIVHDKNDTDNICFIMTGMPYGTVLDWDIERVHAKQKKEIADRVKQFSDNKDKKERKTMFNHKFGKVKDSSLALSYDGKIAVANGNKDYVRYNAETSTVENIQKFVVMDNKFFFVVPATEAAEGDIIKYNDAFYQVLKVNENNISAVNLASSKIETIVKETIFGMSCYAKVISLIDKDTFGNMDSGNMMMYMLMMGDEEMDIKKIMMMQMLGNGGKASNMNPLLMLAMMDDNGDGKDGLDDLLMLQMMQGGNAQLGGDMASNPLMLLMLMDDKNDHCKFSKMLKYMLMSQMIGNNQQKKEE